MRSTSKLIDDCLLQKLTFLMLEDNCRQVLLKYIVPYILTFKQALVHRRHKYPTYFTRQSFYLISIIFIQTVLSVIVFCAICSNPTSLNVSIFINKGCRYICAQTREARTHIGVSGILIKKGHLI